MIIMAHSSGGDGPTAESPYSDRSIRYASAVAPGRPPRFYFELRAPMARTIDDLHLIKLDQD